MTYNLDYHIHHCHNLQLSHPQLPYPQLLNTNYHLPITTTQVSQLGSPCPPQASFPTTVLGKATIIITLSLSTLLSTLTSWPFILETHITQPKVDIDMKPSGQDPGHIQSQLPRPPLSFPPPCPTSTPTNYCNNYLLFLETTPPTKKNLPPLPK